MIVPAVDPAVRIRRASVNDAAALARHRAEMFRDMGKLSDALYEPLVEASAQYFAHAVPSGEYVAWIASEAMVSGAPVAGAGVQLRTLLPRPDEDGLRLVPGPEGLILNVFTERAWRRRGIAASLMHHVLEYARERGLGRIVLHASPEGRALYDQMGFVPTTEMRYAGQPHP